MYGLDCDLKCDCKNNSSCDAETGKCTCSRGWIGDNCDQECPSGFYGYNCSEKCVQNITHITSGTCDHVTGNFTCRPGYTGYTCRYPCESQTYGQDCRHRCQCKYGGKCHYITGECQCLPGWMGPICNIPCPTNTFGIQCLQHCKCENNATCRRNDGHCRCLPGWDGFYCTESEYIFKTNCFLEFYSKLVLECPEGYYGDHCMHPCECPNENFVCDPVLGCVCRIGFVGPNCEDIFKIDGLKNTSRSTFYLFVAILLFFSLVGLIYYYKKRERELKAEIMKVQYLADTHLAGKTFNFFRKSLFL